MRRLNQREKLLSMGVGGALFLLLNLLILSSLVKRHTALKSELAAKASQLKTMEMLIGERELWEKREAWLNEKQPKLTNEGGAGVELLDSIKETARPLGVAIEAPTIGGPVKTAHYRATPVTLETRSSWQALVRFLSAMQQPDRFIVFESVNVQIDAADSTQIRGKFRASRWYAP